MMYFMFGLAALIGFWLLAGWGSRANPRDVVKALKWVAIGVVGVVVALVLITKNFNFIWGLIAALMVWLPRLRMVQQLFRAAKTMRGPTGNQRSEISSRFLDMRLDHDTGDMDGRVREGRFQGALLSELALDEARALRDEILAAADDRSLRLLEAYLDRVHGASWRKPEDGERADDTGAGGGPMSEAEALSLLGLAPGATEDDIKAAHRRLMKQVHPDVGGSAYLAAKINEAKDLLLKA
jgi:hypothetical protein